MATQLEGAAVSGAGSDGAVSRSVLSVASAAPNARPGPNVDASDHAPEPDSGAPHSLPTIFSGLPLDARDPAAPDPRTASHNSLLGRIFSSRRREPSETGIPAESGSLVGYVSQPSSKSERSSSGTVGSSPRLRSLRSMSSKALMSGVAGASPPESPQGLADDEAGAEIANAAEAGPGTLSASRWRSLWARSDRRRSVSYDAQDTLRAQAAGLQKLQLGSTGTLLGPPSQPPPEPEPEQRSRHKRSKSNGQADLQNGLSVAGHGIDGQDDPRNLSMFSFLSCGAAPRVQSDDDPAVKIRPEPYAPLLNLGNLCFHTAVMHCLLNTNGLPTVLWASFPTVPEPPKFAQPEPLATYTVPAPNAARPAEPSSAPSIASNTMRVNGGDAKAQGSQTSSEGPSRQSSADSMVTAGARDDERLSTYSDDSPASARSTAGLPEQARNEQVVAEAPLEALKSEENEGPIVVSNAAAAATSPASDAQPTEDAAHAEGTESMAARPRQPQDGQTEATVVSQQAAPPGNGTQPAENGAAGEQPSTVLLRTQSGQAGECQSDLQVAEMSRRAAAAAKDDPRPAIARRLSQAMAYVMAQMVQSKIPVNPLPAIYYLAQYSTGTSRLINGSQQDVHELWITLNETLNDPENAYPEAGGRLADIFEGTTRMTRTCRKCSDAATGSAEAFTDLILPLPHLGGASVESCLATYCSPSTLALECSKCKAEEDSPQIGLGKKLKKTMFKGKEDSKLCRTTFERLPAVLAIQLHRCVNESEALVKLETAVKVNLNLSLWKYVSEGVKLSKAAQRAEGDKTSTKAGSKPSWKPAENPDSPRDAATSLREEDCEYRLYACICHKGPSQCRGHYYAICRKGAAEDEWYLYDDHNKPVPRGRSEKYLNLSECEKKEVCMLFYERQGRAATPRAKKKGCEEGHC